MAQALGTDRKGSVNIELNIVPFVDVMSCLTAFLLVTAVWLHIAQLQTEPATGASSKSDNEPQKLAILVDSEAITVTATPSGDTRSLPANDWNALQTALHSFAMSDHRPRVEIAALSTDERPVRYQALVSAMNAAVSAGFPDVGITDPRSLSR